MKPVIRQSAASMLLAAGRGDWQSLKVRLVAETTGSRRTEPTGWGEPTVSISLAQQRAGEAPPAKKSPGNVWRDSAQEGGSNPPANSRPGMCCATARRSSLTTTPQKNAPKMRCTTARRGKSCLKSTRKQPPRECAATGHCHRQAGFSQGVRVVSGRNFGDAGFLYIFVN